MYTTAYDDCKAALQARVTEIALADPQKSRVLILIDQYCSALLKQATESATNITAYSISNRNVQKAGAAAFQKVVDNLERQVMAALYGGITTRPDFRQVLTDPGLNR